MPEPGPIERRLAREAVLILDGALATELERRGADLADPLWSARCLIEHPALIRAVHLDYLRAGADILTTATYQATFEGFARRGLDHSAAERLMRAAVTLARDARDEFASGHARGAPRAPALIAGSVGPYGALLADGSEYRGHYGLSDAALAAFHRPRLEVLIEAGVDLIACETLPSRQEAEVLARLLEDLAPITGWISFSCRDGAHDSEGEDIARCAQVLEHSKPVSAVGINCTRPEFLDELLERMAGETTKPLVAYPNSGERYDARTKCWSDVPSEQSLASAAGGWYRAGARLIGGCCRTRPADIAALRAALEGSSRRAGGPNAR
ncbi:MAG TPA: homocysteine S-methyltransferase [Steroidobacteraceae bacterium]|nr:homocysteine S-methyltransferase [Steroidobacteraceae bacterium]